jgi:hypothetical protein
MPIVLKYGSPGPVLAAGYAAGAGHRMHEQQDDALKVWQQNQQREFQAKQAEAGREFQAAQQEKAFGFQSTQAGRARQFQADTRAGESALDATRRVAEAQRHEQFIRDQNTEIGLRRGELALPPAAQAQLDKLEADSVEAMKLDPEKKAEFMAKYGDRKRELYGMAKPVTHSPSADFNRGTVYLDSTGKAFDEPAEGRSPYNIRTGDAVFNEQNAAQQKQQAASQSQITKYYDANRKAVDDNGKPKFSTPEDAMTAALAEHSTVQGMLQGKAPPPAPPAISPQDIATASPQNVQTYNQMQANMASGAQGWTSGGDVTPGKTNYTFPNDAAKSASLAGGLPGVSAPKVAVPVAATQLEPAAAAQLPRVSTPEEARKLPKGSRFIIPDGRQGVVP